MFRRYHGQSGPHSIHDARAYAWALLVFGPGAPPPNRRPHRGQLPDLPEATPLPRRVPLLVRLVRILTLRTLLDATVSGAVAESVEPKPPAKASRPRKLPDTPEGRDTDRNDSLAA